MLKLICVRTLARTDVCQCHCKCSGGMDGLSRLGADSELEVKERDPWDAPVAIVWAHDLGFPGLGFRV